MTGWGWCLVLVLGIACVWLTMALQEERRRNADLRRHAARLLVTGIRARESHERRLEAIRGDR